MLKFIGSWLLKKDIKLVKKNLKEQGIKDIEECANEKDCLTKVKSHYNLESGNLKEFDKQELKDKLVLLENKKVRCKLISTIEEIGIVISIMLAMIASVFSIMANMDNTNINVMSYRSNAKQQIEEYKSKIEQIKKEKSEEELIKYYNERIDEIKEDDQYLTEDSLNNINRYKHNAEMILNLSALLAGILFSVAIYKIMQGGRFENRIVAINIHKSVIEELLEELNKEDRINEDKIKEELNEIQKTLKATQIGIETVRKIFEKR